MMSIEHFMIFLMWTLNDMILYDFQEFKNSKNRSKIPRVDFRFLEISKGGIPMVSKIQI